MLIENAFGNSLGNILEYLPGNVYWIDRNNVVVWCNEEQAKSLGVSSAAEVMGRILFDFLTPESAQLIKQNNDQVIASGMSITLEEEAIFSNHLRRYYLSQKVPLKDGAEVIGVLGISFDIMERKQQEKRLLQEKKKAELDASIKNIYLENILSHLPEYFYWMDKNGRVLGCNERQAHMFGFDSAKDLIGKTIYDVAEKMGWDKSVPDAVRQNDLTVMQTAKPMISEETAYFYSENKQKTLLSYKNPLVGDQGNIIGVFGVTVDITERKEYENELFKAKQEIEKANRGLALVAASIAHELRTPLFAISSGMSGVLKSFDALLDAYQQAKLSGLPVKFIPDCRINSLKAIASNLKKEVAYSNLIIDMLLIKIKQPDYKSELVACEISECITNAINRYPLTVQQRELFQIDTKKGFKFKGNKLFIIHVFFNLIKNALYYTEAVAGGKIEIWLGYNSGYNIVYFKDTGKGISTEVLPHIFDKFYSKTQGGTGVGLAFCKTIMEEIGGYITCDSIEGEYTIFSLFFPK